jgi:hypothetical protein
MLPKIFTFNIIDQIKSMIAHNSWAQNSAKKEKHLQAKKGFFVALCFNRVKKNRKKMFEPDYYHKISRLIKPQSEKEKKLSGFCCEI